MELSGILVDRNKIKGDKMLSYIKANNVKWVGETLKCDHPVAPK